MSQILKLSIIIIYGVAPGLITKFAISAGSAQIKVFAFFCYLTISTASFKLLSSLPTSSNFSLQDIIAFLGLAGTIIAAFLAFVAIQDGRKTKAFEDFRNYLLLEFTEVKNAFEISKKELEILRDKCNGVEIRLTSHDQSFGHRGIIELVVNNKNELLDLKVSIAEQAYQTQETSKRIEELESLWLRLIAGHTKTIE